MSTAIVKSRLAWTGPLLVALALVAPACLREGLAFRTDRRLEIVTPKNESMTTVPVTVQWEMRDRSAIGSFILTRNRSPQPPGEGVDYFVRDDQTCIGPALPTCLQPSFLADKGIYQTTESQFTFDVLAKRTNVPKSEEYRHEVTIALLDAAGRRMGEAAWSVTFTVRH